VSTRYLGTQYQEKALANRLFQRDFLLRSADVAIGIGTGYVGLQCHHWLEAEPGAHAGGAHLIEIRIIDHAVGAELEFSGGAGVWLSVQIVGSAASASQAEAMPVRVIILEMSLGPVRKVRSQKVGMQKWNGGWDG
jgi:hypothetical protein